MNETNKFSQLIASFNQSATNSFDLFLSRNKESYYDQGKYILAWCILYFESISEFNENIKEPDTDWYKWFYNEITKEIISGNDLEKLKENKLKIITFNYDRSFEEFLSQSLFFSFSGDRKDIIRILELIKVIHTYGKILELQWENPNSGEKYQTNKILDLADKAKDNIQIIYDERKTQIEEIQDIIGSAERVFFLGFGYAKENLEALGIMNVLNKYHYVYGTALNFNEREITNVKSLLKKMNPSLQDHHIHIRDDLDCLGLLREYL